MPGNRRRPSSLREQLAVVPVRNAAVAVSSDAGELRIRMQLRAPRWLAPLARLVRLPSERTYILEGIGREAWEAIDGRASLAEIIAAFAERHRLSFHESRAMLLGYLGTLVARGLIVMVGYVAPPSGDLLQV
jgi:hypothetical protein